MKSTLDYVNLLRRYFEEVARQEGVTKWLCLVPWPVVNKMKIAMWMLLMKVLQIFFAYSYEDGFGAAFWVQSRCYSFAQTVSGTVFGDNLNKDLIYV